MLESLDVNEATDQDGISSKNLKAGADEISISLSTLYNSCLKKGQWPNDWKKRGPVHQSIEKMTRSSRRITVL